MRSSNHFPGGPADDDRARGFERTGEGYHQGQTVAPLLTIRESFGIAVDLGVSIRVPRDLMEKLFERHVAASLPRKLLQKVPEQIGGNAAYPAGNPEVYSNLGATTRTPSAPNPLRLDRQTAPERELNFLNSTRTVLGGGNVLLS